MDKHPQIRAGAARHQPAKMRNALAPSRSSLLGRAAISGDVPTVLHSASPKRLFSRLAMLMLDVGMIPPARWTRSVLRLESICSASFAEWIERRVGRLQVFEPRFGASIGGHHALAAEAPDDGQLWIGWSAETTKSVTIGPALRTLAEIHPGLPGTVLFAINKAGWDSIPVVCFDDQLYLAECCIWGGASDADECADDWGMGEEEKAEFVASHITRGEILERTPEFAFAYSKTRLKSHESLERLARAATELPVRRVIELAREIERMKPVEMVRDFQRNASEEGGDFVGYGAALRWSDEDLTLDVFQAVSQSAYESGCGHEECCVQCLRLDDSEAFVALLIELSAALDAMRCLDELLWLLSAEEWSSYPITRDSQ